DRALKAAERDFAREANLLRIREKVGDANAGFIEAAALAERAGETFAELIALRLQARAADGYLHDADSWERAEARFRDALARFEAGDDKRAAERATEAEAAYRAAELAAIKASLLLPTRNLLARAEDNRAERYAPKTLARARDLVARAERELTENRYDVDLPRSLARDADREARHALHLSEYVAAQRSAKAGFEDVMLECESALGSVATAAELAVRFDSGIEPPAAALVDHVREQRVARRRLEREVEERNAQIYAMQAELSRLEEKLGGVSEERLALTEQLAAQEERRRRFDQVEALFDAEEGEVLRSGTDVILRMTGLKFDSGKSEVTEAHGELLAKVIMAIEAFPGARVVVEGNTDSHGAAAYNDRLSTDRARAVRKYLIAKMDLQPTRVDSAGYGESRPIATNDTRDGRARNRRIDIVIQTEATGG
ncbi:MAG: OmpA family protein, partial [Pseudomonadota bacterium]